MEGYSAGATIWKGEGEMIGDSVAIAALTDEPVGFQSLRMRSTPFPLPLAPACAKPLRRRQGRGYREDNEIDFNGSCLPAGRQG